jgi:hypothetical protein
MTRASSALSSASSPARLRFVSEPCGMPVQRETMAETSRDVDVHAAAPATEAAASSTTSIALSGKKRSAM